MAGLLTYGSFYFLHLPISFCCETVVFADFVSEYSGGSVPESNRFPYQAFECTIKLSKFFCLHDIAVLDCQDYLCIDKKSNSH